MQKVNANVESRWSLLTLRRELQDSKEWEGLEEATDVCID